MEASGRLRRRRDADRLDLVLYVTASSSPPMRAQAQTAATFSVAWARARPWSSAVALYECTTTTGQGA